MVGVCGIPPIRGVEGEVGGGVGGGLGGGQKLTLQNMLDDV
jgi:hypothetical protein